jgi:hypothetical protein
MTERARLIDVDAGPLSNPVPPGPYTDTSDYMLNHTIRH